jgi:hypothetical protein
MTPEQIEAFVALSKIDVFRGTSSGELVMNPSGEITRAELAALLRRLSGYMDEHKA